jgi:hypothetical protein
MFADLKIYKTIRTESDSTLLQESLDTLSNYCDYYHLKLNLDKCLQISFSRKVSHKISSCYKIANIPLAKVDSAKDLLVILDSKLTFNEHIKYSYNKALKMLLNVWLKWKILLDPGKWHIFWKFGPYWVQKYPFRQNQRKIRRWSFSRGTFLFY